MGVYSREDILNIVNEEDIRLLKLQFTDMYGMQKSVSLPASRLEKALSGRCVFDGSSIEGFIRRNISSSSLRMKPSMEDAFLTDPP